MGKKYFEVLNLESKVLKCIVCILIAVSFILPGYMVTDDDPIDEIDMSMKIVGYEPETPKLKS